MPTPISRSTYAAMFGPTTGDRVRLGDTDLIIQVERDFTTYGDEVKFGGGKVIRDGMGQRQISRAQGAMDTVITNALIVDYTGIYKADVGLRDGQIAKIGKAGNPDTQFGVTVIIGPGTEIIAGEGRILTAGGMDAHIHFIAPQQIDDALHSGITTILGGGTGPAHGTLAIYTREDVDYLVRAQVLAGDRIRGVETGGCPHTAIREDASINLAAVADLRAKFPDLDLILIESGGDNLAATFSPELADLTIYLIDTAAGQDIPRNRGPGVARSDLLVVNKTDLAPYVGVDLGQHESDTKVARGGRPYVMARLRLRQGVGVDEVVGFLVREGGLVLRPR